ncbi:hypothetical protein BKA93DRAFT_69149 [Sparassis latifolia]
MPLPSLSISDLKGKALQAKDYSTARISRLSSPATKNLSWDTSKPPPPPPPLKKPEKIVHANAQPPPPAHPSSRPSSLDITRPTVTVHARTPSNLKESTPAPSPARAVPLVAIAVNSERPAERGGQDRLDQSIRRGQAGVLQLAG